MIRYSTKAVNVDGIERLETFIVSSNSNSGFFNFTIHERRNISQVELDREYWERFERETGYHAKRI